MKLYLYFTKVPRYRIKGAALFLHSQSVSHKLPGAGFNRYKELQTTEIVVVAVSLYKALRKPAANFFLAPLDYLTLSFKTRPIRRWKNLYSRSFSIITLPLVVDFPRMSRLRGWFNERRM